jgi:hypothetical protein
MSRWLAILVALNFATFGFAQIKPQVKPYRVSPSLKEVVNLHQFVIPKEAQAMLAKNLFVVCPADHWQPFFVYEENAYHGIPNFVTVDSVLHLYHLFFNFALRRLEEEKLSPLAEQLTTKLLAQCMRTYKDAPTKELKDAALRNVAYVAVAANLLNLKPNIPKEAQRMVAIELKLIQARAGLGVGAILPYAIDYTQFIPRGHYTRTEKLKRYFLTMMWYGLFPFTPRYRDNKGDLHWSPVTTRQALLLTHDLYAAKLQDTWDKLFTPINYFVGFADDLTPPEVKGLAEKVFGGLSLQAFANEAKFKEFMEQFTKMRMPQIKPKVAWIAGGLPLLPDPETPQMRLLGQRYTPDSEILQELSHPTMRPIPCGLDVMAVIGSERAKQIHDSGYRVHGLPEGFSMSAWDDYPKVRQKLTERFSRLSQSEWTRNLYWSWLWVLQSLLQPFGEGYPSFMRTEAWQDKSLQTALASWAQLRHDTILYVKQSLVVAEGGEETPKLVKGYVEPNLEAWQRLLHLVRQTRQLLQPRGLLVSTIAEKLDDFESMVAFLLRCAEKQLQNKPLTRDEYERLQFIGGEMDALALHVVSDGKARDWSEVIHPADRNMACVADVHTAVVLFGGLGHVALEEAVGHAHEIFVIVPVEGKLVLARGSVLSYYEFLQLADKRLTDEQWQEMLKKRKAPPQPAWVKSFTVPTKIRIKEVPVP